MRSGLARFARDSSKIKNQESSNNFCLEITISSVFILNEPTYCSLLAVKTKLPNWTKVVGYINTIIKH